MKKVTLNRWEAENGFRANHSNTWAADQISQKFYDEYVMELVRRKAKRVALKCGTPDMQEDIQQDMFLEILAAEKRYDSSKGDEHMFVKGVLRNFAADYIRRHYRSKRKNPKIELVDCETINEDERFSVTNTDPVEIITKQELQNEVNAIVESLPKELQDICQAILDDSSRRKIARDLNISKNALYRRLEALQKVFSESGNKKISKIIQNLRDTFPKTADIYYRGA